MDNSNRVLAVLVWIYNTCGKVGITAMKKKYPEIILIAITALVVMLLEFYKVRYLGYEAISILFLALISFVLASIVALLAERPHNG